MTIKLLPAPLTPEAFARFGKVIELPESAEAPMNAGRFDRTVGLTTTDMVPPGEARIDLARCIETSELPYRIEVLERHPLGSQAFVPLSAFRFVVAVAPPGDELEPESIRAFVSNGRQGINYRRGTWHMPLIARSGQTFLVIERAADDGNCEMRSLPEPVILETPR